MVGYGQHPPHPAWPDDAAIAVQFVVNYEEGAENNLLHGDAGSEAFLSEIVGAESWPGQRHMNMESIYEFGSRAGFWRLHRLFTERNLSATVFGVAMALQRASLPPGVYIGRTSEHSQDLCAEHSHFEYCADTYADELPYWRSSANGPQLMVPYTLDVNDMRFATPQGFNSGEQFYQYLKDSFDVLYAEGLAGAPKMMSVARSSRCTIYGLHWVKTTGLGANQIRRGQTLEANLSSTSVKTGAF